MSTPDEFYISNCRDIICPLCKNFYVTGFDIFAMRQKMLEVDCKRINPKKIQDRINVLEDYIIKEAYVKDQ